MIDIALQNVANQTFSITIGENTFNVALKTTGNGLTIADIVINDVTKILGVACLPNRSILPYPYMESGNLFFVVDGEDYPTYTEFGMTQNLVYLDADEMAAYYG